MCQGTVARAQTSGVSKNSSPLAPKLWSPPPLLEAVVSVDAEAQDRGDLDRLVVAHGGLEFPARESGENLRRHHRRAGSENAGILEVTGCVDGAREAHPGVRQPLCEVGA